MRSPDPAVTVILPTRGLRERAESLRRAIASVLSQSAVRAVPLVVLNGTRRQPEVERGLRGDRRLRLLVREEADLPAALLAGRAAVDTPWFGTLDDDDLLLPGALALRVHALDSRPTHATVVMNGYRRDGTRTVLNIPPTVDVNTDPLRALLRRNWLLPGSWLCRTDDVGESLFTEMPRYLECTPVRWQCSPGFGRGIRTSACRPPTHWITRTISRAGASVLATISWISRRAMRCLTGISLLGASHTGWRSVASDSSVSRSTGTDDVATRSCACSLPSSSATRASAPFQRASSSAATRPFEEESRSYVEIYLDWLLKSLAPA